MEGLLARAALLLFADGTTSARRKQVARTSFLQSEATRSGHLRVTGMARRHLDNRRHRAFIPRIVFRARRGHDTPACGKSAGGREIFRLRGRPTSRPGGAPGGAAPVQRASQTRWIGRRASRAGVATPFVRRVPGASSAPARGLASPWRLPALHSLSERKKGTGGPAPAKQQGRRSVGFHSSLILHPYLRK
jgi:hypothetical protein